MSTHNIFSQPIHLGLGASAEAEPEFTGEMAWYADYSRRHTADGAEGRLVNMFRFEESWSVWEVHPKGAEVVLCTEGAMTLVQELPDGSLHRIPLNAGEYAINPPGVWHTADLDEPATALFITAGEGTEGRPR